MVYCLLCHQSFIEPLTLSKLFLWKKIEPAMCCHDCMNSFHLICQSDELRCSSCQKRLDSETCFDCLYWQQAYPNIAIQHQSLFDYDEAMKRFMQQWKFQGDKHAINIFLKPVKHSLKPFKGYTIVPMPTSISRENERGFNQVETLLEMTGLSYTSLLKKAHLEPQSSKTRSERLETDHRFTVCSENGRFITEQKVLIVDDVYTTGSTMIQAYSAIQEYKPQMIKSFSLAR